MGLVHYVPRMYIIFDRRKWLTGYAEIAMYHVHRWHIIIFKCQNNSQSEKAIKDNVELVEICFTQAG